MIRFLKPKPQVSIKFILTHQKPWGAFLSAQPQNRLILSASVIKYNSGAKQSKKTHIIINVCLYAIAFSSFRLACLCRQHGRQVRNLSLFPLNKGVVKEGFPTRLACGNRYELRLTKEHENNSSQPLPYKGGGFSGQ